MDAAVALPASAAEPVPITRGRALMEALAVYSLTGLPAIAYFLTEGLQTFPGEVPPLWDFLSWLALSAMVWAVPTLYLLNASGPAWSEYGLCRPRVVRDVGFATILFPLSWGLWWVVDRAVSAAGVSQQVWWPDPRPESPAGLIAYILVILAMAFAEELVFRGFLIVRLTQVLGSRGKATILAALLFGSFHLYQGYSGALGATSFGLLFGVAFLLTRRLWPLVVAHTLLNCFRII